VNRRTCTNSIVAYVDEAPGAMKRWESIISELYFPSAKKISLIRQVV